ncbi:unnamed protein product [Peronospora destructor]|uniref:Uncharacterized protein n=1 Tax=Peronospora destructor TaxID=86335 RepID=A0AAV0V5T9_9STRA|nr:unnamed protein product [Peronospora destructor]
MHMEQVATKVQTLAALHYFVAAFNAKWSATKRYCLFSKNITRCTDSECCWTDAISYLFNRMPTYSAYPRTEHEKTPCSFKFTADDTTVRSKFTDLVGGEHCTICCDPPKHGSDSLNFWLVRGSGEAADVQQTIAQLTYTHTKIKAEQSIVLDVVPGVDQMMMVLICIGLLDEGDEDENTQE